MKTYDQAWATAKDRPPFSNGTEGSAWEDNWCGQCVHDRGVRSNAKPGDDPSGCPLLTVAIMGRTPVEWIDQTANGHRLGDTYHCTGYRDDDGGCGGDPEPGPVPVHDAQADIFDVLVTDADVDRMMDQLQPVGTRS